jgi:UDP-2,3-diacylglucosamine pyrophosphatase LpxH
MNDDYIRLVISDIHMGSFHSKESNLKKLLSSTDFDEIILAGDIIDFIKIPRFTEHTADLFQLIANMNQQKKRIIYIVGNHDIAFNKFVGKTIAGIEFVEEYEFEYAGRKYRIEHGDKYETGIIHWRFTMNVISIFHDVLERIFKWNLAAWYVRQQQKKRKLRRIWDIMKWNKGADVFIMGHTHIPEVVIWVDESEKIKTYANIGDWVEHSTYILIKDNQLRLKTFKEDDG